MTLARFASLLLLAAALAGCALNENEADHEAGTSVKTLLEREYAGDYGGAWDDLHPRHQRYVTREEYFECRRGIDIQGTLESILIVDVQDTPLSVYGIPARTPAKRVQVRVTTDEGEYTARYHTVLVGDRWRWVLSDRAARGFARTDCPF
jgi:hypothetical protein